MRHRISFLFTSGIILLAAVSTRSFAAAQSVEPGPGDRMLADYFKKETAAIEDRSLANIKTLEDWNAKKPEYRQQLFEMLGLSPMPERSDLKPVVTGRIEHDSFLVEKLQFQSMPGLYVTADLFLPKKIEKPLPAILYVCGHARVATNGVSFGNKTGYQHHGEWFARNGYVCLIIDTIELGEIQGIHHGTYREGMWWWNSRGYTPAGVEAWNGIRALDYLETRPEVDRNRFGVTGRSGGGAYSWWITALDDRIKCAAPVAGITDLHNHVVDGTVEGHCDCMFIVNTYRWDYAQVAALAAPRPLLICNSDKDSIFPLDGVYRIHQEVRRIYNLNKAGDKLGLLITEGPHKDTQDLQVPVFRWFNRHLKGEDPIIEMAATKFFEPEQLKVFDKLPTDERTSKIHETFVPAAQTPTMPKSPDDWTQQREEWRMALDKKVFAAWPGQTERLLVTRAKAISFGGLSLEVFDFTSQDPVRLSLVVMKTEEGKYSDHVELRALDEAQWMKFTNNLPLHMARWLSSTPAKPDEKHFVSVHETAMIDSLRRECQNQTIVGFAPRGVGLSAWDSSEKKRIQIRRRFMLLGETLDSMRVWDVRRAIQAIRGIDELKSKSLTVSGVGIMGANVLYAALYEPNLASLELTNLPESHRQGPDYLNVLRFLDIPQAVAMAEERTRVHLIDSGNLEWRYPTDVTMRLGWDRGRLRIDSAGAQ